MGVIACEGGSVVRVYDVWEIEHFILCGHNSSV